MTISIVAVSIAFYLFQTLKKHAKNNRNTGLEQALLISIYFSGVLLIVDLMISKQQFLVWIWHIFILSMIGFLLTRKEFTPQRTFIFSFLPFFFTLFISNFIETFFPVFYKKQIEDYIENIEWITGIWIVAVVFMQNRQVKTQEKERIKRAQEDELNRAIAVRKVELESLVVERTSELTLQKEELEQTLKELQQTQTQLIQSEKMASLGELTAGIAHEIQNPLNFINNFSELNSELIEELKEELSKGNYDEVKSITGDIDENEKKILHHGKRADAIVKGMLQHSRSSSNQKEPTDINALCDEYLRLCYHGLRAKDKSFNADMKTDFDPNLPKISIVPQDMGRVILNLLTNAFYAVNEKKKEGILGFEPTVTVSTKSIGNKVEIRISDNGNGIPQKVIDKIFQPFFTTKPTGQGTGLGLSLSYDIVTKGHGGELKAETKEGEGCRFTILLNV